MISVSASAIHHTTTFGDFRIQLIKEYANPHYEHVVLSRGVLKDESGVLCRISSECLTGTALFSAECDCEDQIRFSLGRIAEENRGIFIYLRQEGRGHGLVTKIRALAMKNQGMDTFAAVESLGLPADVREYAVISEILGFYAVKSIALITNNPEKVTALHNANITIDSVVSIPISPNSISLRHLQAKQKRGHNISFITNK